MPSPPPRRDSTLRMSLDWIDCAAILISAYLGILVMSLAGVDLTRHGKWTLGALIAGPLVRRAVIGPPRPHKPTGIRVASFAALVFLATAFVCGGGALMLMTFRLSDGKPIETGIYLAAAVALVTLAIGAVFDRSTRLPR
jgi:hypothetical protein